MPGPPRRASCLLPRIPFCWMPYRFFRDADYEEYGLSFDSGRVVGGGLAGRARRRFAAILFLRRRSHA